MCFLSNFGCKIIFNVLFNVKFCYQQAKIESNSLSKGTVVGDLFMQKQWLVDGWWLNSGESFYF